VAATAACGALAAGWSLAHLRSVACATRYDPAVLRSALRQGASPSSLREALELDPLAIESELLCAVHDATTPASSRAAVNEVLLDLDACLPRDTPVRATCVRLTALGTILGIALLVAQGRAGSIALVDVLAVGGAAALISWSSGDEVCKFIERRRKEFDGLVDALMAAKWGAGWVANQEQSIRAVQPREPGVPRDVDDLTR